MNEFDCSKIDSKKCEVCVKKGVSCCETQPLLTEEEMAEIYFKTEWLSDRKDIIGQSLGGSNEYMFIPKDKIKVLPNGERTIDLTDLGTCIFLDKENGKCKIYDYRPKICRAFGCTKYITCPYEDLTIDELEKGNRNELVKMANERAKYYDKEGWLRDMGIRLNQLISKDLPRLKKITAKDYGYAADDILILLSFYFITNYDNLEIVGIRKEYKYKLVKPVDSNDKASSLRHTVLSTDIKEFKEFIKLINKLEYEYTLLGPDFVDRYVDMANNILKGAGFFNLEGTERDCKMGEKYGEKGIIYGIILLAASLLQKYNSEVRDKPPRWRYVVKNIEDAVNDMLPYICKDLTNGKSSFIFDGLECIEKNASILFNSVMQKKKNLAKKAKKGNKR